MNSVTLIEIPHIFGFALGLDNMAVIAGLGLAAMAKKTQRWILSAFIVFELMMPVLGFALGAYLLPEAFGWSETLGAIFLGISGLLILGTVLYPKIFSNLLDYPAAILLLAFLLGIDNLFAGAAVNLSGGSISTPVIIGFMSAVLSVIGFAFGTQLGLIMRNWNLQKTKLISGAYLSGLALLLAVTNS